MSPIGAEYSGVYPIYSERKPVKGVEPFLFDDAEPVDANWLGGGSIRGQRIEDGGKLAVECKRYEDGTDREEPLLDMVEGLAEGGVVNGQPVAKGEVVKGHIPGMKYTGY